MSEILQNIQSRRRQLECPVLVTDRLVLRNPHSEDMDAIADLANNRHISATLTHMPYPFTCADAAAFIKQHGDDDMGYCVYAITLAETGEFIGACHINPSQQDVNTAELSYWIGEPHWNKGYATEALNALVDAAFRASDIEILSILCPQGSISARRVLQKCGFHFSGSDVKISKAAGQIAIYHYNLDRAHWINLRSIIQPALIA